jgi:hypothetical protein
MTLVTHIGNSVYAAQYLTSGIVPLQRASPWSQLHLILPRNRSKNTVRARREITMRVESL